MEYLSQDILILICIIITEGTFLIYYIKQRPLPININKIIFKIFLIGMILTMVDLIATCCMASGILQHQMGILYILVANYFLVYQWGYLYILEYIMLKCKKNKQLSLLKKIEPIILLIVTALLIINAVTDDLFYLTIDGDCYIGDHHMILHIIPVFVILYSIFNIAINFHKSNYKGIFYALIVILIGIIMQFYINTVALEVCLVLGAGMLYITTESTIFFTSEAINNIYNTKGFIALINDYISRNKKYYVYGISVYNYDSLKQRYGINDFYQGLENFCDWLKAQSKDGYIFYTNNQCFNIVTTEPIDTDEFFKNLVNRTKKSFKTSNNEMYIWPKFLDIQTDNEFCCNGSDIINVEKCAVETYAEKDAKIYIGEDIFKQFNYNKQIEAVIQKALDSREVEIYIQPIFNSFTQKIEGGEVLTRIKDPELGLVMPNDFISLAERNGSIFELSLLIFEKTCKYVSKHDLERIGINFMNINCSPVQFQNINLVKELKGISDKYGVYFSLFDFEVTESNMNTENLLEYHIAKIKEYNATASLDDFGKGGSDIFRLLNYDFSLAKLDKSVVWNYFDQKSTVMTDIISMFKHENLKIVAEGVEDEKMVTELSRLGCDYLQGYHFSKPLPAKDFFDFVKQFNQIH